MADDVTPQHEISALELGAVAYAAFCASVNGTDANGVPLPDFAHLHEQYRQAWVAAALAACAAHVAAQPPPVPASAPEGKASPAESDESDEPETPGYRRGRR